MGRCRWAASGLHPDVLAAEGPTLREMSHPLARRVLCQLPPHTVRGRALLLSGVREAAGVDGPVERLGYQASPRLGKSPGHGSRPGAASGAFAAAGARGMPGARCLRSAPQAAASQFRAVLHGRPPTSCPPGAADQGRAGRASGARSQAALGGHVAPGPFLGPPPCPLQLAGPVATDHPRRPPWVFRSLLPVPGPPGHLLTPAASTWLSAESAWGGGDESGHQRCPSVGWLQDRPWGGC